MNLLAAGALALASFGSIAERPEEESLSMPPSPTEGQKADPDAPRNRAEHHSRGSNRINGMTPMDRRLAVAGRSVAARRKTVTVR